MVEVKDFRDWCERCAKRGWKGPFKISGQPHWQYIGDKTGTEAVWNDDHGKGYIFMEWKPPENGDGGI